MSIKPFDDLDITDPIMFGDAEHKGVRYDVFARDPFIILRTGHGKIQKSP